LVVLAAFALRAQPARTPPPGDSEKPAEIAIFYDGPTQPLAEGYLDALQIENLLGHFGLRGRHIPIAAYQPGELAGYRAAFFIGTVSGTRFPQGFLGEVLASHQPFCWIGRHIGSLANSPRGRRLGFTYIDYRDDLEFRQVVYKNTRLPKGDPDLNIVSVTDPRSVQVLAVAVNDENDRHPYALRQGRFWYFADSPFSYVEEGSRYLVFCDLLHDILEIPHGASARALVRIEDVSTEIDPGDLRAVADTLAARRIPFQISIIPIFRNPSKGFEVYLSDRQNLVDAIHYMIARGGAPVMHGTTHQYRGPSGDDYEFWDEAGGRPIQRDSAGLVLERLGLGWKECLANGIFPIAFETPHYGASETDYLAMRQVFSLFNERTMPTPDVASIQYFPYPVIDRFGRYVVPENLGYLPAENPDPRILIERARNMRVVRDAIASFYFHPFLDPALLAETARGITEAGFRFVSLREFGGAVDLGGHYALRTSSDRVRLTPQKQYWRSRGFDGAGKLVSETVSASPSSGAVEVDVRPPAGGWAVVDCIAEAPRRTSTAGWRARLAQWESRLWPARRFLGGNGDLAPSPRAWVLWLSAASPAEDNNQRSYRTLLETFGYQTAILPLDRFRAGPAGRGTILVVPEGAGEHLEPFQQDAVLSYIRAGGLAVLEGRQKWLEPLGFRWSGHSITVSTVTDVLYPEMDLRWRPEDRVERFTPPEGAEQLMVEPQSKQLLALAGGYGSGRYVYLAVPLDPHTPGATSHYPYFPEYLAEAFRLPPSPRSPGIEAYFDPSYREGANLERLAASWRQEGIRTIYAAAWHFYRDYAFDYERLIAACHRNGIAVYAWLVLPATTPLMWDQHPEWRERTASGGAGRVSWRYSMNLQNPACFRAAMEWMNGLLAGRAWDGVNISELNFDADFEDYLRPDRFVPMNADVRADFRSQAGFDPVLLFAPASPYYYKRNPQALERFLKYREDVVATWHERVLSDLAPLARARGWEVIITMLDSLHSRYVQPALGVDSRRIIALMSRFDFTLQVEDPSEHWIAPPDRYRRFAETYRRLVPDPRRLMFDINVVPDRGVEGTSLPSSTAAGVELARTAAAAASASGRAAIYSEYTVPAQDWRLIGTALAGPAAVSAANAGWRLHSPVPLLLGSPAGAEYYLDGRLWPARLSDGLLVPAGRRSLSAVRPWYAALDRGSPPARLVDLNGELLDARARRTGIEIQYRSPGRAVLVLNQKPREMFVDGAPAQAQWERASGGDWVVAAPRGEHRIVVETFTRAGVLVNFWGWMSASAIAGFGALTTALMAVIYLHIRMRRLARRGGLS
jgi:hypothetical protein